MPEKHLKLVQILQKHGTVPDLYFYADSDTPEYIRVSRSQYSEIISGKFFAGDLIEIIKTEEGNQIVKAGEEDFESTEIKHEQLSLPELLKGEYTKFLNSTLPITSENQIPRKRGEKMKSEGIFQGKYKIEQTEVPGLMNSPSGPFIAKILQKTRITLYPGSYNPFFFLIVASQYSTAKIVFWKESLTQYSALKPGDIIYVTDYKRKKKTLAPNKMLYNSFTESVYFDCNEYTAKELFLVEMNDSGKINRLFESISGKVVYSSVVLKMECHEIYQEYIFLRLLGRNEENEIQEFSVMLFNNSEGDFYNLRDRTVTLHEMRKIQRGSFEFHLSTIYTSIQIEEEEPEFEEIAYDIFNDEVVKRNKIEDSKIYGSIGFLPDFVSSDENPVEIISGENLSVEKFFVSVHSSFEAILTAKLVINECKKFNFRGTVTSIEISEVSIEYFENEIIKEQTCYVLNLSDGNFIYLLSNFLVDGKYSVENCRNISEIREKLVGTERILFVDALRVAYDSVLIYLTGFVE